MNDDTPIYAFHGPFRFLSNFYPFPILWEGVQWPSTEYAYQAAKTIDPACRESIRRASTPGDAKRLGGKVPIREDWERIKLDVMLELLFLKFAGTELEPPLLDTYPHTLIEGNTWNDTFWGICRGRGENHLGRLLMQVRQELRE